MKITSGDVFGYDLQYAHGEYVMSGKRTDTHQIGTLVRLRTDAGSDGWGEVTPLGNRYLPTHWAEVRAALQTMTPALVGLDPTNIADVSRRLDEVLSAGTAAKSAIDVACWDLLGQAAGLPVSTLLGGVLQPDFPLYEAVGLSTPDSMADFITEAQTRNIRRFQLKVGDEPSEDARRVRAAIEAGEEGTVIVADANGGWNLRQAQIALSEMADLPVLIEQPCLSMDDCIFVAKKSTLPIVLDECILTAEDVFRAKHEAGAVAVNIKLSRVGGITPAARMRDLVQELGMMVTIEDTWGGDLVTAAVSHLAATTRPEHFLSASFMNDWTDGHVADHQPRSVLGRGAAPTTPGLGITVRAEGLQKLFSVP